MNLSVTASNAKPWGTDGREVSPLTSMCRHIDPANMQITRN